MDILAWLMHAQAIIWIHQPVAHEWPSQRIYSWFWQHCAIIKPHRETFAFKTFPKRILDAAVLSAVIDQQKALTVLRLKAAFN